MGGICAGKVESRPVRTRLPHRRPNETQDICYHGTMYSVTLGAKPGGNVGEVFTHGAKVGSMMDAILDDACVLFSLLLQYGADPKDIAASMSRVETGSPASILGVIADVVAED